MSYILAFLVIQVALLASLPPFGWHTAILCAVGLGLLVAIL